MFSDQDRSFMEMALDEAQLSFNDNEVPVGAIIVKDNEVIGSGHNKVCLLYTSPSPRDRQKSRMPSSA